MMYWIDVSSSVPIVRGRIPTIDATDPMKSRIIVILVGLTVAASVAGLGPVGKLLDDIYPKNAAKAEALRLCILANPNFNRLDSDARDACYYHAFAEQALTPPVQATESKAPNQVDFRQSSALSGHVGNDIRVIQQSDHSLR